MSALLDDALLLARKGVRVFPCGDDKRPVLEADADGVLHRYKWGKGASANAFDIAKMPWKNATLIGAVTGDRFDVVDVDLKYGGINWLNEYRSRLPRTREHGTRSGGVHLLFQHSPGMRCSVHAIAPGVDVRATGGYIVWWPAAGFPVANDVLSPWPGWLLEMAMPPPPPPPAPCNVHVGNPDRLAAKALMSAVDRILTAEPGKQAVVLNRETFCIGKRFVANGTLPRGEAEAALLAAGYAMAVYRPEDPWLAWDVRARVMKALSDGARRTA